MSRYLFLDIDGCINSAHYIWNFEQVNGRDAEIGSIDHIEEERVKIFNSLFTVLPDIKIVLSSDWRLDHSPEEMTSLLRQKGYIGPDIISSTPDLNTQRGDEVLAWLKENVDIENDLYSFCALDDNSDFKSMRRFLIQTDMHYGIRDSDVKRVVSLLSREISLEEKRHLFNI